MALSPPRSTANSLDTRRVVPLVEDLELDQPPSRVTDILAKISPIGYADGNGEHQPRSVHVRPNVASRPSA